MTSNYVLGTRGNAASLIVGALNSRMMFFNNAVDHLIKIIIAASKLFGKKSLQEEFKNLDFSDLFCEYSSRLNETGFSNLFFIFLELRELIFEDFAKEKFESEPNFCVPDIEFDADERNELIDFILNNIDISILNINQTNEELTTLANNLFKKHPSYEKVLDVKKRRKVKRKFAEESFLEFIIEVIEVADEVEVRFGLNNYEHDKLFLILDAESKSYFGRDSDEVSSILMDIAVKTMDEQNKKQLDIAFLEEALLMRDEFYKKYDISILQKGSLFKALVEESYHYNHGEEILLKMRIFAKQLMVDWGKTKE